MTSTSTISSLNEVQSHVTSIYNRQGSQQSTHDSVYPLQRQAPQDLRQEEQPPPNAFDVVPDGGYGWNVVAACAIFIFWTNGYLTTWGVMQTAILRKAQLKTSISTITFVGSLALALLVIFGLPSVRLFSMFGVRNVCMGSALLLSTGSILASLTLDNLGGLFCTAGLLMGIGSSTLYTVGNILPNQWFSSRLGTSQGLIKAGGGVGATVLPLAAQALIDRVGLAWTFRVFGFLMLATTLPAALLLRERVPASDAPRIEWSFLRNVPFLCLCLAGGVSTFALFVPPFFLPVFAASVGLTASTGAGLVAGFGAASTCGRLVCGVTCDKLGPLNTLAITMLVNTVSMLAIWPISSTLGPLVLFAVINGCGNGAFFVALPTAIAALAGPGAAAGAQSLGTSFWAPGYLFGSAIAGILISSTGAAGSASLVPYRAAIFYAGGVSLCGAALALAARLKANNKVMKKL